ncbi:MAG: butyrate kinase [Bacillota bacterium]|nr:butyrate kinase [Bacillota bacterium]
MSEDLRVLAINPGSTSTKIAVFAGDRLLLESKVEHRPEELKGFKKATDQYEYRLNVLRRALAAAGIDLKTLAAVVGRGGLLKPLAGGTYRVNAQMVDDLINRPGADHASNLGAVIAYHLGQELGIPAFIVDPVVVDEYEEVARISGHPAIERLSRSHALNMKAVARKVAADLGRSYQDVTLVVAHLGSGFSISVHREGRMIDTTNANDEGPLSIERAGDLPTTQLVAFCYEKFRQGLSTEDVQGILTKESGLYAYLGIKDLREAERQAAAGDARAARVLDAMVYQVAKAIGAMATVVEGRVDRVVLTGGVAHSERITAGVRRRVEFIAPVVVVPGEEELPALAQGALRVLRGEETAQEYA